MLPVTRVLYTNTITHTQHGHDQLTIFKNLTIVCQGLTKVTGSHVFVNEDSVFKGNKLSSV